MIDVTVSAEGASAFLLATPPAIGRALARNFDVLGSRFERLIKGDLLTGTVLQRRTGMGIRSIFHRVTLGDVQTVVSESGMRTTGNVVLEVGSNLAIAPYMRVQALGGVIRPKKGQYLAIPLAAMKTGNGVARASAGDVRANPGAFGFSGTFVSRGISKGGTPIVFGRVDGGTKAGRRLSSGPNIVPLFALVKEVTIPARNYLLIAQTFLGRETRAAIDDAVAEGLAAARNTGGV